jgi:hypothetical protein
MLMRHALATVFFAIILGACASSTEVEVAQGQRGYSIDCSGDNLNWSLCYEEAGQICGPKGFEILDKTGGTGVVIAGIAYGVYRQPEEQRSMLVKCRNPQLQEPMSNDAK